MARFLRELGYLGLGVSSLPAWRKFLSEVVGAEVMPGDTPDVNLVRIDRMKYRFILVEDGADDVSFIGWDAYDDARLDGFARHLDEIGLAYEWATEAELKLRGVARMLHFEDPNRVRHEAAIGLPRAATPFVSPIVQSHYVTEQGGMGHVVLTSKDYEGCKQFAKTVLGAGTSDTIAFEMMPGRILDVTFFHINERHHSVAYAAVPAPKKIHHFMLEVGSMSDVGHARDRHLKMGLPIPQDIGQHPNDKMISYYGVVPSGFLMEYGWGAITVTPDNWQTGAYTQLSEWGHRPAASSDTIASHAD